MPTVDGLMTFNCAPKFSIGLPDKIIVETENFMISKDYFVCSESARDAFVTLYWGVTGHKNVCIPGVLRPKEQGSKITVWDYK